MYFSERCTVELGQYSLHFSITEYEIIHITLHLRAKKYRCNSEKFVHILGKRAIKKYINKQYDSATRSHF